MVSAIRKGKSLRAVARRFGVGKSTVGRWLKHAGNKRLDRVDFSDRPSEPFATQRPLASIEDLILDVRHDLKDNSVLGEYGAQAICRELLARHVDQVPAVRTIGRILDRRGVLDCKRRFRRPAPPKGWYLPEVVNSKADVDSFDLIEDLRIQDGPMVDVLTVISVHGRLADAWPFQAQITAEDTLACILTHWRTAGLPSYAQFDNDTRFQGAHHHRDSISRVMRLCLLLGVTPVFAPPRETGFQAAIENFNRRWQDVVWTRFHHPGLAELATRSDQFIHAHRHRNGCHIDEAPLRRDFPMRFLCDLQKHPSGKLIYLRRTDENGQTSLLGHVFPVDRRWPHRLVRCEFHITSERIYFFALRRREPSWQPLLKEVHHQLPRRRFKE
jgi:hypothetical protein